MIENSLSYDALVGWRSLIEKLLADVEAATGAYRVRLVELKEKYGSLRVEFEPVGDVPRDIMASIEQLVREVEDESERVCIKCGDAGLLHDWRGEWVSPLCPDHARERIGKPGPEYTGAGWRLTADWRLVDDRGQPLDVQAIAELDAAAEQRALTANGVEYSPELTWDWRAARWVAK